MSESSPHKLLESRVFGKFETDRCPVEVAAPVFGNWDQFALVIRAP
jgi:hypothetical protein